MNKAKKLVACVKLSRLPVRTEPGHIELLYV